MTILTQEQLLLNAQVQFDALKEQILADSQEQIRIDQAERNVFDELLALGLTLLQAFAAGAGLGDEGEQVSRDGRMLHRSDKLHREIPGRLKNLKDLDDGSEQECPKPG